MDDATREALREALMQEIGPAMVNGIPAMVVELADAEAAIERHDDDELKNIARRNDIDLKRYGIDD